MSRATSARLLKPICAAPAGFILKVQDEIEPQWRIASPSGDWHLAITLPPETHERLQILEHIARFMAWKQATSYTLASELAEPDALYCAGISRTGHCACWSTITRHPKPWTKAIFGEVAWLPEHVIDPTLSGLLPEPDSRVSDADSLKLQRLFGAQGPIPCGEH